jgi:sec-independent protein translocase protein TatA
MIAGVSEILIILVLVGVLFGAGKLPAVMEAIGRGVGEFERGKRDGDPPEE